MKKKFLTLILCTMLGLLCLGCGAKDVEAPTTEESENVEVSEEASEEGKEEVVEEVIPEIPTDFEIVDMVPVVDIMPLYVTGGKIQEISYTTKDYYGDESEITKKAFVYLPPKYDETKQYNVLYLMHVIGVDEK